MTLNGAHEIPGDANEAHRGGNGRERFCYGYEHVRRERTSLIASRI